MRRLGDLLFMCFGATVGWFAGMGFGIFTSFILAVVGTGSGLYLSRRLADRLLP